MTSTMCSLSSNSPPVDNAPGGRSCLKYLTLHSAFNLGVLIEGMVL